MLIQRLDSSNSRPLRSPSFEEEIARIGSA